MDITIRLAAWIMDGISCGLFYRKIFGNRQGCLRICLCFAAAACVCGAAAEGWAALCAAGVYSLLQILLLRRLFAADRFRIFQAVYESTVSGLCAWLVLFPLLGWNQALFLAAPAAGMVFRQISAFLLEKAGKSESGVRMFAGSLVLFLCALPALYQIIADAQWHSVRNAVFLLFFTLFNLCFMASSALFYFQKKRAGRTIESMEEYLDVQQQYYQSLEYSRNRIEQTRRDYLAQAEHLSRLLCQGKKEEALSALSSLSDFTQHTRARQYCRNSTINAMLNEKAARCSHEGIGFAADIVLREELLISDLDLCIAMGNILDNAIRGCLHQEVGDRDILIKVRMVQNFLVIHCENSCPQDAGEKIYGTGCGQKILKDLARRYAGYFHTEKKKDPQGWRYLCLLNLRNIGTKPARQERKAEEMAERTGLFAAVQGENG